MSINCIFKLYGTSDVTRGFKQPQKALSNKLPNLGSSLATLPETFDAERRLAILFIGVLGRC
jgi:hypothetical protein